MEKGNRQTHTERGGGSQTNPSLWRWSMARLWKALETEQA